jgi:rare lipoprotein A
MKTILKTVMLLLLATSCSVVPATTMEPQSVKQYVTVQSGEASWYSTKCNSGTRTASGKPLQNYAATAAHKTLPFGTRVKVTHIKSGKSEIVTITDDGPHVKNRIIDVTIGVAKRLGFYSNGVAQVKLEIIELGPKPRR